ncbi:TPR-like protein [Serendipita vermifera]|nr:TPR-like protein [Serendipita vermifera]
MSSLRSTQPDFNALTLQPILKTSEDSSFDASGPDADLWKTFMGLASKVATQEESDSAESHPEIPPSETISRIDKSRELMEEIEKQGVQRRHTIRHSFTDAVYSTTPLTELEVYSLQDLQVRQHNAGSYLLCRTITQASRSNVLSIGVEDTNGWSQQLSIYNFPGTHSATTGELDTLFPLYTVLAIREPLIESTLLGDHFHIRVDSPSDIVFLKDKDPLLKGVTWASGKRTCAVQARSAEEWKEVGDKHSSSKEFVAAIVAYTYALQRDPSMASLLFDRANAHMELGNYASAILDAKAMLGFKDLEIPDYIKAVYLLGATEYNAGNYTESKRWYEMLSQFESMAPVIEQNKFSAGMREKESTTGDYNWGLLLQKTIKDIEPQIANFIGPVEVVDIPDRDGVRGVIATRDIIPGELLVASKAIISSRAKDPKHPETVIHLDLSTGSIDHPSVYAVFQKAVEKTSMDPQFAAQLGSIYGGEAYPALPEDVPSSETSENPLKPSLDVDTGRIRTICSQNTFNHILTLGGSLKFDPADTRACLHIFPSHFNHSCVPNAQYTTLPDVIFIRAVQAIEKGEEIFLTFGPFGGSYEERSKIQRKWMDECDCPLCCSDREVPSSQTEKRQDLLKRINNPSTSLEEMKELVKEVDATFPEDYPYLRWEAFQVYRRLAERLKESGEENEESPAYTDIIQANIAALEALGAQVTDGDVTSEQEGESNSLPISTDRIPYQLAQAVTLCLEVSRYFKAMKIDWRAEQWLRAAIWIDDKVLGDGVDMFRFKYAKEVKEKYPEIQDLLKSIEADE